MALVAACCAFATASSAGAATSAETGAVNWAAGQVGSTSWGYLCLSFVYDAWQNGSGVNLRNDTSGVAYNSNTDPQNVWGHFTTGTTGVGEPPYGALVFFDAKSGYDPEYYSHVAIMGANGQMISTNDAFNEYAVHYETLAQEQSSGSYSTYVGWWLPDGSSGSGGGGGGLANGSFVQVSGSSAIYEIAGGAPLYVSSWAHVGGSHPYSVVSEQEFSALPQAPANGTFLRDAGSGGIWEVAGGAPLYVSSCANLGGCNGAINVDLWDIQNAGNPASHLHQVPSNGTYLRDPTGYTIWEVAGGAPLVVSSCANLGGCPGAVNIDPYAVSHLDHLEATPSNGTLIRDPSSGSIWEVAGGAPLYVSTCANLGGCSDAVNIDPYAVANSDHLNPVPANGTFLRDPVGYTIWEVAGGAPLVVSSCANLGGCPGAVNIDPYAISHLNHLNAVPSDGTLIRDPGSGSVWDVAGGAPLYVSSCDHLNGCPGIVNIDPYAVAHLDHLNAAPANGTFLNTSAGRVYRIAGGAPFLVSSWSMFGGTKSSVAVDQWDIDNTANPEAHLRSAPADGTLVEGLPSDAYWSFDSGERTETNPNGAAVQVDDAGLLAFPQAARKAASSPAGVPGSSSEAGGATPGSTARPTPTVQSHSSSACLAPRLLHLTLPAARRALARSHCRLGKVTRPRRSKVDHHLRVRSQSPRPGSRERINAPVNVVVR